MLSQPRSHTGRDLIIALLLLIASATALGLAQKDVGITRDEATYFQAAERYWNWFAEVGKQATTGHWRRIFDRNTIEQHFSYNNEHPALFKILFGISWRVFHRCDCVELGSSFHPSNYRNPHNTLGWLSETSAFRLPAWLFFGLCVALLYLIGINIAGTACGLCAALLYATIPRAFFHGQLACFDNPITTMWLLVVYGYIRSLSSSGWAWATALFFGLALATKHNAWFLPPLLVIHYLIVIKPDISLSPLRLPRIPMVFVMMATVSPLIFWLHWPWMWHDTVSRLDQYFGFHLHHAYYNIEYLGHNLSKPPLPPSYPFVMTLVTMPVVLLFLSCAGAIALITTNHIRQKNDGTDLVQSSAKRTWKQPGMGLNPRYGVLIAIQSLFPLILIALPSTPKFGGIKHFLPAFPFICLIAGIAIAELGSALSINDPRMRRWVPFLASIVTLPGAVSTYLTHPFGLSQYNALAGGPTGGATAGFVRQYWGYSPVVLLPYLNKNLAPQSRVYFHDVSYDTYGMYQRSGQLRSDIIYAGMELPAIEASTHAMVVHELHFNKYDYWIWLTYGHPIVTQLVTLDGVPLVSLYQRDQTSTSTFSNDIKQSR